jgi:hypothetical protein
MPNGTANHQDQEGGLSPPMDANGVNILDYDFSFNVNDETFKNHDCIYAMGVN